MVDKGQVTEDILAQNAQQEGGGQVTEDILAQNALQQAEDEDEGTMFGTRHRESGTSIWRPCLHAVHALFPPLTCT